jgi:hypothetical protein
MGVTQITTRQIGASGVTRDDLDTTTTTKAVVAKLVAGTNVSFSSTGVDAGTGDVTINASGGGSGMNFTEVTGSAPHTTAMAVGAGYISSNTALETFSLPTTAAIGTLLSIRGKGTGLFKISQAASQLIHFGDKDTITGTTGYIQSVDPNDSIDLICIVADLEWMVQDSTGNFDINM